jgi:GxxExxY protein
MLVDAPFNSVTHDVIGAAIEVHRVLGPGLLESAYIPCLQYELNARKIRFITQRQLPIVYKAIVPKLVDGVRRVINPRVANRD